MYNKLSLTKLSLTKLSLTSAMLRNASVKKVSTKNQRYEQTFFNIGDVEESFLFLCQNFLNWGVALASPQLKKV
jgi:hypothetical protein